MTIKILKDFDLKNFNTFGVSAKAAECVRVSSEEDLEQVRQYLAENPGKKHLVLGGGSDILFTKDFDGLVILMESKGVQIEGEDENHTFVRASAGETWHTFVRRTLDRGLAGLENLALIPGTVGAAPIQNIGAYGMDASQAILSVRCFDLETGEKFDLNKDECDFGYRYSVFKTDKAKNWIITSVLFNLPKNWEPNLSYRELKQEISRSQSPSAVTPQDVYASVVGLRQRKLPDPQKIGNAGSFFKNPIIDKSEFLPILQSNPDIAFYPAGDEKVKISAAWLIDSAGLKGIRMGDCGTYERQPLVLINYGAATGEEIYALAQGIRLQVKNHYGIRLSPEVVIV